MPAGTFNLTNDFRMEQGATFELLLAWKSDGSTMDDLSSDYEARMQVRRTAKSSSALVSSTSDDDITLYDGTGSYNIKILIPATKMSNAKSGSGVWDFELENTTTGIVTRLLEGEAYIKAEVTR